MQAVLEAKFARNTAVAAALLKSGDAFLLDTGAKHRREQVGPMLHLMFSEHAWMVAEVLHPWNLKDAEISVEDDGGGLHLVPVSSESSAVPGEALQVDSPEARA